MNRFKRGITMFKVKIPSFEIYKIATRPAVLTSLKQMLQYMDIDLNHKIFFNGESEVSKLLSGEYDDRRGDDTRTDVGYDNKIFVELEQDLAGYNDELDGLTNDDTVPPLWVEPLTGTTISPKYSTRRFTVTVNKYFKDRVTAQRFYTNVRSKTLGISQNTLFDVETHYPITYPMMNLFKEIYDRLDNVGLVKLEQDENFVDWMGKHSTVPWAIIRNLIGNNPCFVFKQKICDNGVIMENPSLAKVNKGAYFGAYEVSFSYSFYWSEHTEWVMKYPIQVYQQPIPVEYMPEVFDMNQENYATRRFFESAASEKIWDYNKNHAPFYHVLPIQDNWRPDPINWISPQLQVLVNAEDIDNQVLLNIKDINGFDWDPTFIKYIMKYHDKVTQWHHSPLQFKVFSNETEVLNSQIILNESGDLILTRKPRMGNIYRVTFNLDYALRQYSEDAVLDLISDPEYGKWIIDLLFPQVPLWQGWGEGGIDDWYTYVHNEVEIGDGDPLYPVPNGMLGSLIIAHNSETYQRYIQLKDRGTIDGTSYYRWAETEAERRENPSGELPPHHR